MTIYERIKYLRENLGLSQDDLAEKVGFKGRSSISKVENGERDISQSMIKKYADALNVTPTYLLTGEEAIRLELEPNEIKLIKAYRKHPEMQNAVNTLLGIEVDK